MNKISVNGTSLAKDLIFHIFSSAIIYKYLKPNDLKNKKKVNSFIKSFCKNIDRNKLSIDHTDDVLKDARKYKLHNEVDKAYLFYAVFFEHQINFLITIMCVKNNWDIKVAKGLIRRLKLEDKFGWLLSIFKLPKFNLNHFKTIDNLFQKRNEYVHYKYPQMTLDETENDLSEQSTKNAAQKIISIEKTIKYCKLYISKVIFENKKIISLSGIKKL